MDKSLMTTLNEYLTAKGWQPRDVPAIVEAYGEQNYIFGAVKTIESFDDESHHYTDELIQDIIDWEQLTKQN